MTFACGGGAGKTQMNLGVGAALKKRIAHKGLLHPLQHTASGPSWSHCAPLQGLPVDVVETALRRYECRAHRGRAP